MARNFLKFIPVLALLAALCAPVLAARADIIPDPARDAVLAAAGTKDETIVLAGGCFWGVEAVFEHLKGVKSVASGYAGGEPSTAHYNVVTGGTTGHAESVIVTYDPSVVTLGQILKVFFAVAHNPTQLNFQGPDHGTQYRSAIFTSNAEQKAIAAAYIDQLDTAKAFSDKIVTQVNDLKAFYPAEDYHQDFASRNPMHPYIMMHDAPKVAAFKKDLAGLYVAQK